jgi:hypothetical protein
MLGHDWDDLRVREAVEAFASRCAFAARKHPSTNIWQLYPA